MFEFPKDYKTVHRGSSGYLRPNLESVYGGMAH